MGSTRCRLAYAWGMPMIVFEDGAVQINGTIVGEGLGIDPPLVQPLMREGKITGRYKRGVDEDAGRHRLTLFRESWRLSLIVDDAGKVVQLCVVDPGNRPVPPSLRRPPPREPESEGAG